MIFTPNLDVILVGSLPHKKPEKAYKLISKYENIIPHSPELPHFDSSEFLINQNHEKRITSWKKSLSLAKKNSRKIFKTQICGPITLFGKNPKQKQIETYKKNAKALILEIQKNKLDPILVLDEPMFSDRSKYTIPILKEVTSYLNKSAVIGIHSCNMVSPKNLIATGANLIHFDLALCIELLYDSREEIRDYIRNNGAIAWGLIPTTLQSKKAANPLADALIDVISAFNTFGISVEKTLTQSAISPSCGLANLTEKEASLIIEAASKVCNNLKLRYKLSDHACIHS